MNPYCIATKAWWRSLPIIILIPIGAWFAFFLSSWISDGYEELQRYFFSALFAGSGSAITHFAYYLLIGLPLFLIGYRKEFGWIFNPLVASALGLLLGLACGVLVEGADLSSSQFMMSIGALYGLWSGLLASRFKPKPSL